MKGEEENGSRMFCVDEFEKWMEKGVEEIEKEEFRIRIQTMYDVLFKIMMIGESIEMEKENFRLVFVEK